MEVATTNNHSQSHHHHHHHLQAVAAVAAQSHGSVGVGGGGGVSGSGSRSPFQREVREWQRIDPNTGALFSGRLEADRWINGPLNSYGKISDSQNISQPNGTQHTQRKQLEVLKARTANGAMQVIRTQTVQKTSSTSTSRGWATSSTSTTTRTSNGHLGSSTDPSPPCHMPSIWAPPSISRPSSQSVDICELSDDNSSLSGSLSSDVGIVSPSASASASMSTLSKRNGQELIDDHVDFVVINGEASDQDADDVVVAHLHKLGHNLLPDTAPSLKLSNLMKSSSSISSQSSNNSNLTTATATAGNTHRSAGKISLHAIVGPESSSSTTSTPSLSLSSAWAKQQQQADLYGQPPASSSSSRVGVSQAQPQPGTGAGSDADVAVVVGSTPTRLRRDLESFRHYNDDAANDDDLRLSARHQRRQQVSQSVYAPPLAAIGTGLGLQRSRSISTDDLSNDWERNEEQEQEPGEWRRVSKLRRSFQSQDHYKTASKTSTITRPRPLDLPSNSVSVARMRAELENGRRLNTAMRNNHVDLAALDTILNNPQQTTKPTVAKRNTFLTAESLQEIRGKLKKLSDESLYKEDFLAYHQARPKLREQSEELHVPVQVAAPLPAPSAFRPVHNTHSLQSRQRQKDTSSSEWHLRRKSYGFEKMSPPEDKSIFRVDASTDSGLGRSGEQLGNWSPTERERERTAAAAAATAHLNNGGGTIIHFGRLPKPPASPANEGELSKRHSIAVEETWRDIRKTSQVHVNGGTVATTSTSTTNSSSHLQRSSAQKRVEFCKTEVHFAAESGRVNIVETDGKPPPTNNFRRRRRTTASGPLQSLVKSASAGTNGSSSSSTSSRTSHDNVTHFGDDPQRRKTIATSTVAYRATLMDPPEVVSQPTSTSTSTATSSQVTVTTLAKPVLEPRFSLTESTSRNSYTSTSGVDTTDNETDELSNIRGILKNKPVKPKPYHLGENIESADVLWSVPAMKGERESPSGRDSGITSDSPISVKSVAERIRIVEQRQQNQKQPSPAGNGYSTKINVSLGTDEWPESGTHHYSPLHRRPSAQELLLEDLRHHQRILDEGLKSTSLIMKTMRSASEFDEAMRRLSIASIESALIQPSIVVPTPMLRSHSYQEETSSSRRTSTTSITSSDLFASALYDSLPRTPLAPPRLKLLGNTQIPVSQQLTQLRRLYDAAEQDEDSADEEVKRYFRDNNNSDSGGGTQASSSPEPSAMHHHQQADVFKGSEYSSSWSRLKAKRTIWKIEAQDQMLQRADLPKSNVMNIALHSPRVEKPKATPPTLRIGQLIPVAKPRTLFIQPQPTSVETPGDESGSESLKIVKEARGARKLREHELSYFGVQQQQQQKQQQTKLSSPCTNPRRTLPSRSKLSHSEEVAPTTTTTKWQLLNDRPDLLRHSPQDNDYEDDDDDDDDEHCYENIANELTTTFRVKSPSPSPSRSRSPGSYERKTDLQRDAQILSEMTRNADQTLKALSDEAAIKDQRRRSCSLQRRSGKPLETIDEKVNKVHNGDRQSLSVARGTFASEARRNSRQSTPSPTPTRARSSSQSSIECCPRDRSRSSSRESNTQGAGSSDDQATKHRAERLRMRTPKREKSRQEHLEHRSSRHTHASKPRSSSSATAHAAVATSSLEAKRSSHHSSHRLREVEHSIENKHSSGSRLLRSSRVSDESRSRQSALRERERERDRERSRGSEKHREELTRSRGHSSRSRPSSEQADQAAGTRESSRPSKTRSSRSSHETTTAHKKSTSAAAKSSKSTTHKPSATTTITTTSTSTNNTTATTPSTHNELTYVYVTNLAHTKSGEESEAEANEINADTDADANGDYASIEEISNASPMVPLPPPRRKRKRSLIPVPVQPTASYEYRTKLEMIPPSYSNQSTLRCRSMARHGMKKPSLKATQSTSSSFAFLPYLPAKRNSSVSHVYDNYLLYTAAGGASASASASASQKLQKLRPYQNNLSNDHAQLFGGTAGTGAGAATRGPGRLGGWPKRLRMRQVRSSVSTHQPFGICTCS
ncbi:serine-rich adhesin for platelets isoform X1 [Drosophila miranda]|uniref:serine-rich adhesin for platelets isoform X1 n=1 Tax=Drosophila miranda TaxID=7229 RepID=UPI0007E81A3F|nr:serine-rich adhesin for platelets isoform X1 [Drosophila miranda]XP_017154805.1 serine-rich adhesin for platelets isoform X1 [Drosophila miranda]XP_017154808.1 serine-rich adhesin for platelets isoform X1 [Drosophila miranda]